MTGAIAYLDYNASAPVRPCAQTAAQAALALGGNPSSVHRAGRRARAMVEEAREQLAASIGAAPRQIVFTSGGTEANHLALRGFPGACVLVSGIEHDSVLAAGGPTAERIPVDRRGIVDLDALERMLTEAGPETLVSVMLANNETGVIQPVAAVVAIARRHGARVHCDAAQGLGRIPVEFAALGVDLLTLSGHKIGAGPGAGALAIADGVVVQPLLTGGGQEMGVRAGTENVPGIAAFGAAAEAACAGLAAEAGRVRGLRDVLEAAVAASGIDARIVGAEAERLPNTSCVARPGMAAELQVIGLDLAGVGVSAGSACSSGKVRRSHVLSAMGFDDDVAASAIRVSLGWASTEQDVARFVAAWRALGRRAEAPAAIRAA